MPIPFESLSSQSLREKCPRSSSQSGRTVMRSGASKMVISYGDVAVNDWLLESSKNWNYHSFIAETLDSTSNFVE
jgi:hypothetical protein